ncbi:hypothetical protein ERY430_40616 [Erythrobacter sp. EC-HK427]|nr:hypothetical protein ERY430_40616 [Erythrobacter sp. EC-HK427]
MSARAESSSQSGLTAIGPKVTVPISEEQMADNGPKENCLILGSLTPKAALQQTTQLRTFRTAPRSKA